jgi:subtilisin-like proprotein convertase family protein
MDSKSRWARVAAAGVLATVALTVPAAAASASPGGSSLGCSASSDFDVAIPDNGSAASLVLISGCVFVQAPTTAIVDIHIVHPRRGDLVIDLVSPDGQAFRVRDADPTDEGADINETVLVSLRGEPAATVNRPAVVVNGRWALRVQDVATRATGFIDSWSLSLS